MVFKILMLGEEIDMYINPLSSPGRDHTPINVTTLSWVWAILDELKGLIY